MEVRGEDCCLVDENGNVNERALRVIVCALRAFEMGRRMDGRFRERLRKNLENNEIRSILKRLARATRMMNFFQNSSLWLMAT